jgi:hypothetical protein
LTTEIYRLIAGSVAIVKVLNVTDAKICAIPVVIPGKGRVKPASGLEKSSNLVLDEYTDKPLPFGSGS